MQRQRMIVPAFLVLTTLAVPGQAFAQDASQATPPADMGEQLVCTAEPRNIDELLPLWFDETGNPIATPAMTEGVMDTADLPQGEPADAATLTEIEETTRGWIACFFVDADYARGFNFMTDDLAARFGPDTSLPEEDTADEVRTLLEGQLAGTPIPGDQGMDMTPTVAGPDEARLLEDGRVAAVWSLDGDQALLIYEQQDGRWLIDDVIEIQEVGATPGN